MKDLESKNLIIKNKKERYARFFVSEELSKNHREFLHLIRNPTIRHIILLMLVKTGVSQKYLS